MTNYELINKIKDSLDSYKHIHPDKIPNIDLYMDQVTTFMDTYLEDTKRSPEDKVLTKTMINNYAKNNLLPSPVNKKYTENHIIQLLLIYYMKSFLSINDIETILKPVSEHLWNDNFPEIYETIFSCCDSRLDDIKNELDRYFTLSRSAFPSDSENTLDCKQLFSLLSMLNYEIYVKKNIVTSIIDALKEQLDNEALAAKSKQKEKHVKNKN